MSETPWQKVSGRLKLRGAGLVKSAKCPSHDDRHESLSVTQNAHGDVLITCHAGCAVEDVVSHIDLQMADLFFGDDRVPSEPIIYTYRDERGEPLYEVHKWVGDDGRKKYAQRRAGSPEWGLGDVRRVLYRLPDLLRAKPSDVAFVVEGEKDVENAVAKLGVLATCNLGGAGKGKWRREWNEYFAERDVVVIPDNDEVGRAHAEEVRASLDGIAKSVVVLHLPNVPEKGDLSDWIRAGGTREDLYRLVAAARLNKHPHVILGFELHDRVVDLYERGFPKGISTGLSSLDEFYTVRWGELTVVTGAPGSGKTSFVDFLMINLAIKDHRFGVFSAENLPTERHVASLAERYVGKPFEAPRTQFGRERMEARELEVALSFLEERFHFIEPQDGGQTVDDILDAGRWLVDKKGVKGLVLDPWNELEHKRPKGQTETEFIGESLMKIRRFARLHMIHFFVVAHPQKMQRGKDGKYPVPTLWDISGSSHWYNKSDNGLVIYRVEGDANITEVHIPKIRFKEVGRVGMVQLSYDKPSGRYADIVSKESLFTGVRDDDDD